MQEKDLQGTKPLFRWNSSLCFVKFTQFDSERKFLAIKLMRSRNSASSIR